MGLPTPFSLVWIRSLIRQRDAWPLLPGESSFKASYDTLTLQARLRLYMSRLDPVVAG